MEKYSINRRVDQGVWIDHNVNIDDVQQVPVRKVWLKDHDICRWLEPARNNKKRDFLGYLAIIGLHITVFSLNQNVAVSTALFYSKHGYKGIFTKANNELIRNQTCKRKSRQ